MLEQKVGMLYLLIKMKEGEWIVLEQKALNVVLTCKDERRWVKSAGTKSLECCTYLKRWKKVSSF